MEHLFASWDSSAIPDLENKAFLAVVFLYRNKEE
jgi:hypothetical protein